MAQDTFSNALSLQGRVLWALSLREVHGRHGKLRIGYLWQLVRVSFGIFIFWGIREFRGFQPPDGLSVPEFLLLGFIPYYIFSESVSKIMEAINTNRALLTFPQITPLDLCLSGAIVTAATQLVVLVIFLAGLIIAGYDVRIYNIQVFVFSLCGVGIFGIGTGLVLMALALYITALEHAVPIIMRILFFTSGVFFSPVKLSELIGIDLMWNPMANYIEMLRNSLVSPYINEAVKLEFTIFITIILLGLGLILERHVRPLQGIIKP